MAASTAAQEPIYYPEDRLPWGQTALMGIQHVMAMFGATVVVPLILGFNVNTVLLFSGIATLLFLAITGGKVPSYLGSSFSFIGSVLAIQGGAGHNQPLAFAGIFIAGALYFVAGFVVHRAGTRIIRAFMPPVVTGAVVAVIGLALAPVAWGSYSKDLVTATVTILAAVLASVYLRGFLRLLPILIGIVVGYVVALLDPACAAAAAGCHVNWQLVSGAPWLGHPKLSFPPQFTWKALSLFWFVPILLIAENTGHVYAISGLMKRDLSGFLGRAFMGDGLGTMLSALFGGTGETTYAENIGVMGVTRVFSISVYATAAVVAILLGFIPKFGGLVGSIPLSVLGGIELYLFGLIAAIGGKIWVDGRVDFSNRANLATAAIPLILAASGADIKAGAFEINNLGLGALGAIILYQLLRPGSGIERDDVYA
ncbi:MAG TPA: solute carrier family 23 protein [bacterium]|nr:solute carrier family 23 protein [bacterium]